MKRLLSKPLRLNTGIIRFIKGIVHAGVIGYLGSLFYLGVTDKLGADPVATLLHNSGQTAIILLLLTLCMSPLAKHLPCGDLIKFRRLLGIYSFVAGLYHLTIFAVFDLQLDFTLLWNEIIDRPYITVGLSALLILLALTITSLNTLKIKMGRRWQTLHNGVYLALILAMVHFSWSEKTLLQTSVYYWIATITILSFRFSALKKSKRPKTSSIKK